MNQRDTIAEVAIKALRSIGRAGSIEEIYAEILEQDLYRFNTPTPEHVLRTTIRRHTRDSERSDARDEILFDMVGEEIYTLAENENTSGKKPSNPGMKRIQRASDKEEIIKDLMSEQVGVFKEIWRLLLFAAQVGFKNGRREPLKGVEAGKGIDQSTFGNSPAWPGVLYLMALAETGGADCLSGTPEAEEDRVSTFQEYANGGLAILKNFFADRPLEMGGILEFIESQREKIEKRPDVDLTI
jgi:dnd system-associated protein 4